MKMLPSPEDSYTAAAGRFATAVRSLFWVMVREARLFDLMRWLARRLASLKRLRDNRRAV